MRYRNSAARAVAAGLMAAAAGLSASVVAAADPPPAVDPAIPVPPPAPDAPPPAADPEAHPLTGFANVIGGLSGQELLLGQSSAPALPGTAEFTPPNVDILNGASLLLPQNYRVPPEDQNSPYQLAPGVPGPFARVDALKGVHAIVHGALGRMPADQLGEPLPGTAPPPGTNIPPGPEQFLPDPAIPLPPPVPAG
jgi:hypothetical protein